MFPLSNILGILLLLAIADTRFYVRVLKSSIPVFLVLLSAVSFSYWGSRPSSPTAAYADTELAGRGFAADRLQADASVGRLER